MALVASMAVDDATVVLVFGERSAAPTPDASGCKACIISIWSPARAGS